MFKPGVKSSGETPLSVDGGVAKRKRKALENMQGAPRPGAKHDKVCKLNAEGNEVLYLYKNIKTAAAALNVTHQAISKCASPCFCQVLCLSVHVPP